MEELYPLFDGLSLTSEIEVFLLISALSFIPFLLIATTTFARNIIVLSFLRQALGLQQSPPNLILITLAMFLTIFVMSPVFKTAYDEGFSEYISGEATFEEAAESSWQPVKSFLISQTYEQDLALIYNLAEDPIPETSGEVDAVHLIPAFLLSELKTAFKIGFVIYLPFLLIDLAAAAMLMSLGMIMVPPITISLPLKIMLFVVVDGWTLITTTLIQSVTG